MNEKILQIVIEELESTLGNIPANEADLRVAKSIEVLKALTISE